MRITARRRAFTIAGTALQVRRTTGGVVELWGQHWFDLARGLGFVHAVDRQTQMLLVRLVGQGRLCECLHDADDTLAIDMAMRQLGFAQLARREAETCPPAVREFAEAYAAGVNQALRDGRRAWEFRLAGYVPEPWAVEDTLLTILLMSYVGLAQTQQDLEKLLIQAVHDGVDAARLKRLFSPHLDGLSDEIVDLIRQVTLFDPIVPALPAVLPVLSASNSWAVAPGKSASGKALQCNDPHLECNRLPAAWYEAVLHTPDDYQIGATMPGVPGVVMGRTRRVSAGFTYGFMDQIDYFVEEVRDGACRRADGFVPLDVRRETIRRKKHPPVEITLHQTSHGFLEADPRAAHLADGTYLCRAISSQLGGTARSLAALAQMPRARTVADAQQVLRQTSISCNWVIADRDGHIGYQQSGLLPRRNHSGLHPVPAWDDDRAWQGLVPAERLMALADPPEGFVASANDDWNSPAGPLSINVCQGTYRAERIAELLRERGPLTAADMRRIQADLMSPQARRFMDVLRPHIPESATGRILSGWDLSYDCESRGATLFERFYQALLHQVFGKGLFGGETWEALAGSTNLLGVYFQTFDEALLGDDPAWYPGTTREAVFRDLLDRVLSVPADSVRAWGDARTFVMQNLFFGGKLPVWLSRAFGIDYGPVPLPGGRATIRQGQIFRTHGRLSTFAPSWRFVCDLGTDEAHTALAGGPSDRTFSRWYTTDVPLWLAREYKTLSAK